MHNNSINHMVQHEGEQLCETEYCDIKFDKNGSFIYICRQTYDKNLIHAYIAGTR